MIRRFLAKFTVTKADIGLAVLVGIYVAAGYAIAFISGAGDFYNPVMYVSTGIEFTNVLILGYIVLWGLWAFYVMIVRRPQKLAATLHENLKKYALNPERYIRALPVLLCCIVLLSTFTSLKVMIPYVNGFKWDAAIADLDHAIHGGHDAWQILHPLLGHRYITLTINFVYNIWLLVLYIGLYWQLLSLKDPHTRMQFFYTLTLCWAIIGSFLAMTFSSGGPCYYHLIVGTERFTPLMDYLYAIGGSDDHKIWALVNQDNLWKAYVTKEHGIGAGVSAMPSVHVSTALLFMLAGLRSDKKAWRIAGIGFFSCILLGSIHLGWHYAADGYVAAALTLALWHGAGLLLNRIEHCHKGKTVQPSPPPL